MRQGRPLDEGLCYLHDDQEFTERKSARRSEERERVKSGKEKSQLEALWIGITSVEEK